MADIIFSIVTDFVGYVSNLGDTDGILDPQRPCGRRQTLKKKRIVLSLHCIASNGRTRDSGGTEVSPLYTIHCHIMYHLTYIL